MICYASATTFIYPCKLSFRYPKNTFFLYYILKSSWRALKISMQSKFRDAFNLVLMKSLFSSFLISYT